ncbi:MAG: hypothetical protein RL732_259 [Bacteroidota bacterium]|jgi:hypothetical protein
MKTTAAMIQRCVLWIRYINDPRCRSICVENGLMIIVYL